jgi:hypothetical protein
MAIDHEPAEGRRAKSRLSVLITEARCVMSTLVLLAHDEIALPDDNVGRVVGFGDGTRSQVYRETAMRKRRREGLVLLVVRFRLRFIGSSRLAHWLFRLESIMNTVLFAAHPGFQTKLWLTDRRTWFYRGIYEWVGEEAAVEYVETLRVVLRPWVQRGSFAYRVIRDRSRVEYLDGAEMETPPGPDDGWSAAVGHAAAIADEPR